MKLNRFLTSEKTCFWTLILVFSLSTFSCQMMPDEKAEFELLEKDYEDCWQEFRDDFFDTYGVIYDSIVFPDTTSLFDYEIDFEQNQQLQISDFKSGKILAAYASDSSSKDSISSIYKYYYSIVMLDENPTFWLKYPALSYLPDSNIKMIIFEPHPYKISPLPTEIEYTYSTKGWSTWDGRTRISINIEVTDTIPQICQIVISDISLTQAIAEEGGFHYEKMENRTIMFPMLLLKDEITKPPCKHPYTKVFRGFGFFAAIIIWWIIVFAISMNKESDGAALFGLIFSILAIISLLFVFFNSVYPFTVVARWFIYIQPPILSIFIAFLANIIISAIIWVLIPNKWISGE